MELGLLVRPDSELGFLVVACLFLELESRLRDPFEEQLLPSQLSSLSSFFFDLAFLCGLALTATRLMQHATSKN